MVSTGNRSIRLTLFAAGILPAMAVAKVAGISGGYLSEGEKTDAIRLGPAIVKEIIERIRGDLTATDHPGQGTGITFRVPEVPEHCHA